MVTQKIIFEVFRASRIGVCLLLFRTNVVLYLLWMLLREMLRMFLVFAIHTNFLSMLVRSLLLSCCLVPIEIDLSWPLSFRTSLSISS